MEIIELHNAFKHENTLKILKKKEFDIFYSCRYKYPLLTAESLHPKSGKSADGIPIKRGEIKDPFRTDPMLPRDCRLYIRNYMDYMQFGGSLGHNVPAAHHKTDMSVYSETFLLSNMCPQEIVFNGSLWVVLEAWCLLLKKNDRITDIRVFTGSIPDIKNIQLSGTTSINIPKFMFKVVTCRRISNPKMLLVNCFLMPNTPPKSKIHKLYDYLQPLYKISNITKINFAEIFRYYCKYDAKLDIIGDMNSFIRTDIHLNNYPILLKQMHAAEWYGRIVYSLTLDELETHWTQAKHHGFGDEFHEAFYKSARKRIEHLETLSIDAKDLINTNSALFNKVYCYKNTKNSRKQRQPIGT